MSTFDRHADIKYAVKIVGDNEEERLEKANELIQMEYFLMYVYRSYETFSIVYFASTHGTIDEVDELSAEQRCDANSSNVVKRGMFSTIYV